MFKKHFTASAALAALLAFSASAAHAVPVALELALLVDVSGSVSNDEYNLQKTGYVNAFNNATIQASIASLTGGIAVTYIEWSGSTQQSVRVDWTQLTDATSASAFATAISSTTRAFSGTTEPDDAINFTTPRFSGNSFEGSRWVIDVSGDGTGNEVATANARDNFLNTVVSGEGTQKAINGLAIGNTTIENWYNLYIKGGTNSFVILASNFNDFETAIIDKLGREIPPSSIPEPASLALLSIGLAGLGFTRRRRRA